jgi:Anaphase-promoting complex subunit 4 WD40 domain
MSPAFTPLLDRALPSTVRYAAWCPTMDLLALVMEDNRVHVHRLNWQRLWVTTPQAEVSGKACMVIGVGWGGVLASMGSATHLPVGTDMNIPCTVSSPSHPHPLYSPGMVSERKETAAGRRRRQRVGAGDGGRRY